MTDTTNDTKTTATDIIQNILLRNRPENLLSLLYNNIYKGEIIEDSKMDRPTTPDRQRVLFIFNKLLTMARKEAGKFEYSPEFKIVLSESIDCYNTGLPKDTILKVITDKPITLDAELEISPEKHFKTGITLLTGKVLFLDKNGQKQTIEGVYLPHILQRGKVYDSLSLPKKSLKKITVKINPKSISIGNIELDINQEVKKTDLIPQNTKNIIINAEKLQVIAHCIKHQNPLLLVGETGTGKTSLIEYLAHLTNSPFIRLNLDGATTKDEFVGKWLVNEKGTYWIDGILTKALKEGYWLLLDEVNAALPEITMALHSVLEENGKLILADKDGSVIKPHPNFRVFGTCNPDSYAGTKEFNQAFLSRFNAVIYMDYLAQDIETQLIIDRTTTDTPTAQILTLLATNLRNAKKNGIISYPCSTRDLLACAEMSKSTGLKQAIEVSIKNKMQVQEDKTLLDDLIALYL